MKDEYRLGLDIGTNSLGWAIWRLGEKGPEEIVDMGVRIFPDGREPGKNGTPGLSLAVNRRMARGMRRMRDRALRRKKVLVNELVRQELWPKEEGRFDYSCWDPYKLRAKALRKRLEPAELGRILLHFAQRRGFKSNRKLDSGDDEMGMNKKRIAALKEKLKSERFETLGEYLNSRKKTGARFREGSEFYPDRQLYIDEFRRIQEGQKEYFPKLGWDDLYKILFSQRGLKPQVKGRCQFTGEERARKCLPSSHRSRILQELANMRIIDSHGGKISLSREEFSLVFEKLERQKSLTFSKLRTLLKVNRRFNLEDEKRKKLSGNDTSYELRKKDHFGDLWDDFDEKTQDDIVNEIVEAEEDSKLRDYLYRYKLSSSQVEKIVKLTFPGGISRYSACFNRMCSRIMRRDCVGFAAACKTLGCDHRLPEGRGEAELLPYYGEVLSESCIPHGAPNQNASEAEFGKIGNPTVHITMNQLRRVVNPLIEKHGKPKEIVLETSRELKHGRKKVSEIIHQQTENRKYNEKLDKELKEDFSLTNPGPDDSDKLRYYKELKLKNSTAFCPYCGKVIKAEDLFDSGIEVEHILPFLRTLDDGRNNKTIAHKKCNHSKGDKSPYEAFGHSPKGFNWQEICSRASYLPGGKRWRFDQDAMERFENNGFIARQLTDNAYNAKAARRYLTAICHTDRVWGVACRQTAELRRQWGLNHILSKKGDVNNRSDHRHHAVDAAVIGLIDRSMIQSIAEANSRSEGYLRRAKFKAPPFPGGEEGRRRVAAVVKSIVPSFRPDHGSGGRLYKETAYGKIRKALPLDTADLKKDMIARIVPVRVRKEFENMKDKEGFKKTKKTLLKIHPRVRVMQELWTTSKPITSIEESDLKEPAYGKNTRGPSDFALRKRLKEYIKEYIKERPEEELKKVLESYSEVSGVRHVRYIPKNQEIKAIASSPGKGYEIGDYAYADIWKIPDSKGKGSYKYEGIFVSKLEARRIEQKGSVPRKPHPAARRLMRLHKNDTIRVEGEKYCLIYRIAGFSTKANKLDIQPIYAGNESWFENTNPKSLDVSYPSPKKSRPQCFKSVNSLWHKHSRITRIIVRCDGSFR